MSDTEHTDRDWIEDFEHENGRHLRNCAWCSQRFIGHKRRNSCRKCSESDDARAEIEWKEENMEEQVASLTSQLEQALAQRDKFAGDSIELANEIEKWKRTLEIVKERDDKDFNALKETERALTAERDKAMRLSESWERRYMDTAKDLDSATETIRALNAERDQKPLTGDLAQLYGKLCSLRGIHPHLIPAQWLETLRNAKHLESENSRIAQHLSEYLVDLAEANTKISALRTAAQEMVVKAERIIYNPTGYKDWQEIAGTVATLASLISPPVEKKGEATEEKPCGFCLTYPGECPEHRAPASPPTERTDGEADTKRLDWLEAHDFAMSGDRIETFISTGVCKGPIYEPTTRKAIDAAIQATSASEGSAE